MFKRKMTAVLEEWNKFHKKTLTIIDARQVGKSTVV